MKINLVTFQNITKNNSGTINSNQHLLYKQEYDSVSFSGEKSQWEYKTVSGFNKKLHEFVNSKLNNEMSDEDKENRQIELENELYQFESRKNYKKNKRNLTKLRKNFPELSSITVDDDKTFKEILGNLYEKVNSHQFETTIRSVQSLKKYEELMNALLEAQEEIDAIEKMSHPTPKDWNTIVDI